MNKTSVAIIVFLIVVVGGGFFLFRTSQPSVTPPPPAGGPPPPSSGFGSVVEVTMTDSEYAPDRFVVKRGDTVKFVNAGTDDRWPASNIHPTHSIFPEFDPKRPIPPGQSWSFTFDKIGIWRMHDHLDPIIVGVVMVE